MSARAAVHAGTEKFQMSRTSNTNMAELLCNYRQYEKSFKRQARKASSYKRQAPSSKPQAPSHKRQAP